MSADELCRLVPRHAAVEPRLCDVYTRLETPRTRHPQQTGAARRRSPASLPRVTLCHGDGLRFLRVLHDTTDTPREVHGHAGSDTFLHCTQLPSEYDVDFLTPLIITDSPMRSNLSNVYPRSESCMCVCKISRTPIFFIVFCPRSLDPPLTAKFLAQKATTEGGTMNAPCI